MQYPTVADIKKRIDQPFFDTLVKSAGLEISYVQLNYVAMEGPGDAGEVKPLLGEKPHTRFVTKCPQLPDLGLANSKLDLLQFSTYNYITKVVRFCVVVDGVEIFGSATALRAHGFFTAGDEIKTFEGKFEGGAHVRMAALDKPDDHVKAPFHRFFARSITDLPKVYAVMESRGKVMEVCFRPESFDQLVSKGIFVNPSSL